MADCRMPQELGDAPPERFETELLAMGPRFDPEVLRATRELYRPYVDLAPVVVEQQDLSYGLHDRHKLDVYHAPGRARAIVIFVHGGGFVAGDKRAEGGFYSNVGRWLARNDFTAVLPNYRLAPAHPWPAGAEDVGAVVEWSREYFTARDNAALPLVLWGQSAGANHVATWLFDPRQQGRERCHALAAVMLMSGFYEAIAPLSPGPAAYFGADASTYADRSPLNHAGAVGVPLLLSLAELDPVWLAPQTYALARALTLAQGRSPCFHFFGGHNHVSTVHSIGTPHTSASDGVLKFLDSLLVTRRKR